MNIDFLQHKKAVIFDMDGLLIDSEPFWQVVEKEIFKEYNIIISNQESKDSMGLKNTEVVALMSNRYQLSPAYHNEICSKIENGVVQKIQKDGVLMQGVLDILHECRKHDLKIALATSSSHKIINAVLDTFQLRSYFQLICSAYDEDYGKPHPAVFLRAIEKLNEPHHACFVLEDSVNGVIAAKAAKLFTIAIPDSHDFENPKFSIADLKCVSLSDCVQQLFPRIK